MSEQTHNSSLGFHESPDKVSAVNQDASTERPVMLELRHITCCYEAGRPAIHSVSFCARQGEIVCLLGPSGCGKTTTLRAIAGFEPVTSGEIHLNGELVSAPGHHVPPERRRAGMVFQEYALFPHLRVIDNIAFGLNHFTAEERRRRVQGLLALIGLEDLERRYPHELSGGQQQRVALVRALAPRPAILLLDEPFSNLDPDMTYKMREELHQLLKQTQTTAILVTHDHEEAFTIADQVALLHEGQLVQFGTPETIYHLPASPFVAEFVGQADFIPGVIQNNMTVTEIGEFPKPVEYQGDPQVLVMVRPDDVQIRSTGKGTARIESRQFRGSENLYTIRLASGHTVHCSEHSTTVYPLDAAVELNLTATHTVLFEKSRP
ncbi:MAG: ABC transporter ATP-binding protein [Nitrospirota bacterium]|nr:ABC transporter ATP-binding protein [Nitrospirota bacterium]